MDDLTRTPPRVPFVTTRRTALKGVGATLTALVLSAANPRAQGRAFASTALQNQSDVDILNFGLRLEQLELELLNQVLAGSSLPPELVPVFTRIRDQETVHVDKLTQLIGDLGGTPQAPQTFTFGALDTPDRILQVSQRVEDVCIGGYGGATARATERKVVRWCANITQVEATHAALYRILAGQLPTTGAYAALLQANEADTQVAQFTP
jgi:rubrerythrin